MWFLCLRGKDRKKEKWKKPVYTFKHENELVPTFLVQYGTYYLLGKPRTRRPLAEHTEGLILPWSQPYLPQKLTDCLLCIRHWEDIREQNSHSIGVSGLWLEKWPVEFLGGMSPLTWAEPSETITNPLSLWNLIRHRVRVSSTSQEVVGVESTIWKDWAVRKLCLWAKMRTTGRLPGTLSSQRAWSWSCLCSKSWPSGSLFLWTWNLDLRFWNQI